MKILISAVTCSPYQGSETYFGWAAVKCPAQDHQICVITSDRGRLSIDRALAEGLVPPSVRFFYAAKVKPWHPNRMLA